MGVVPARTITIGCQLFGHVWGKITDHPRSGWVMSPCKYCPMRMATRKDYQKGTAWMRNNIN